MAKLRFQLTVSVDLDIEAQDQVQDYLMDIDLLDYVPDSLEFVPLDEKTFYALPKRFRDTRQYANQKKEELELLERRIKFLSEERERRVIEESEEK